MKPTLLAGIVLLSLFAVPTPGAEEPVGESIPEPEVRLYKDGRLTLDRVPTTLEKLTQSLEKFRFDGVTEIHYFREGSNEGHPDGPKILKLLLDGGFRVTVFNDEALKRTMGILIPS